MSKILDTIKDPADLRKLSVDDLTKLAVEIRAEILQVVSRNGGHLSSNLGVVEMTLALHKAFDTPRDLIIWDVGHQTYTHKIVTGRRDRFPTLRRRDGLLGFPSRDESPYDAYNTGHASTALSAALGLAIARDVVRSHGGEITLDDSPRGGLRAIIRLTACAPRLASEGRRTLLPCGRLRGGGQPAGLGRSSKRRACDGDFAATGVPELRRDRSSGTSP